MRDLRQRFGGKCWRRAAIPLALLIVSCVIAFLATTIYQVAEAHARACLATNEQLAVGALDEMVPAGQFTAAWETAEYIRFNYPVGTVLPSWHGFAAEYERRRHEQIMRIQDAVEKAEAAVDVGEGRPSDLPEKAAEPATTPPRPIRD